jgi:2-C-methyl-D-erythritol 4-phosphate cytidylyltransferase
MTPPAGATALVVAAGGSRRMGFDKLLAPLADRPVLWRALAAFQECADISGIVVAASARVREALNTWTASGDFPKILRVTEGGAERHLSVWEGLRAVPDASPLVAVHDGARPLVSPAQISRCVETAAITGAAVCARPLTETIKRVQGGGVVRESIDRAGVWIMETPQVFRRELLMDAYERVIADGLLVTDEVSAAQHAGHSVHVVTNPDPNPKITYPEDLPLAARLLAAAG